MAPVTVWTAGQLPGEAGLTVSSVPVAQDQPACLLGLIDPTSASWEAMKEAGAFVVHVLAVGDRAGRAAWRLTGAVPVGHGELVGRDRAAGAATGRRVISPITLEVRGANPLPATF